MSNVHDFYDSEAKTYGSQYQRENLTKEKVYPAEYFRLQILLQRIAYLGIKSVYEVGVGEGTPLTTIADLGCFVGGCDISEEMVLKARATFKSKRFSEDVIQWGDIQDATTLVKTIKPSNGYFDAVIAAGVLPHVANDRLALTNMGMFLRTGGRLFVEFRNKLFSLFTFNRHTRDFIINDLLKNVPIQVQVFSDEYLQRHLDVNEPPKSKFEEIAKFHNPFELEETLRACGYKNIKFHWYHYHCAPPLIEPSLGDTFRKESMALEHEGTWRGFFLCSAGVIEAVKE